MRRAQRRFQDQLDLLSDRLKQLGRATESAIEASIRALVDRDSRLARVVVEGDARIDGLELEIDEICVDLLALQQPLAADFRFLTTAMKVTADLERIADHAVNISERALELNDEPPWPLGEIPLMGRSAQQMVHESLGALMDRDADRARATIRRDREINRMMERTFEHLMQLMVEDPTAVSRAMRLVFVAKNFERIGDQATNVCEQVVFMSEARVIKHPGIDPAGRRN